MGEFRFLGKEVYFYVCNKWRNDVLINIFFMLVFKFIYI